jgi:hypothetical protein
MPLNRLAFVIVCLLVSSESPGVVSRRVDTFLFRGRDSTGRRRRRHWRSPSKIRPPLRKSDHQILEGCIRKDIAFGKIIVSHLPGSFRLSVVCKGPTAEDRVRRIGSPGTVSESMPRPAETRLWWNSKGFVYLNAIPAVLLGEVCEEAVHDEPIRLRLRVVFQRSTPLQVPTGACAFASSSVGGRFGLVALGD